MIYLYTHTKKNNEIFYIGVGTKDMNAKTKKQMYKRAYCPHKK